MAIVVFGLVTIGSVKQELFPNISFPIVSITTIYPGASAEVVDQDVTAPVEHAISGIQGIESSQSTSAEGFAFTIIQFDVNVDLKEAKASVQDKVGALKLPSGVQAPQVGTFDFTSLPAINASVSGKTGDVSLSDVQARMETDVVPALSSIPGVSNVSLTGGEQTQVLVTLNPTAMASNKLSQQQVVQVLQANNLLFPVGTLDEAGRSLPVRVTHQYTSTEEIGNLVIGIKGANLGGSGAGAGAGGLPSAPVTGTTQTPPQIPDALLLRLKDVATVELSKTGGTTITRTNGQPNLGLQIFTDQDANIVDVTGAVKQEMQAAENAQSSTPISFKIVSEQATTIQNSIAGVTQEGLLGALVAVVVIFLFLLSVRTTLIAAVSIPVSVVVALIVMQLQGYSLNVITLGGLAVAIGRVVDDSIVVLENIYRHVRKGDDLNRSKIEGVREVAGAITTSTLTTVAVFLPLGLAGGLVSKLFLPFSLTVTYALLSSLLVALTVVPLLARLFMGRLQIGTHEDDTWLQRVYTPVLKWSLRYRWATLVIAAVLFFSSIAVATQLKFTFIPDTAQKNISIKLSTPPGTDLQTTTAKVLQVEDIAKVLQSQGKVADIQTTIGKGGSSLSQASLAGGAGSSTPNEASLTLALTSNAGDSQTLADDIKAQIGAIGGFDSVTVQTVGATSFGGGASSGLDIVLVSADQNALRAANQKILDRIGGDKGADLNVTNVTSNLADVKPALKIDVDPQKAILHGTTTAQVALQIQSLLNGQSVGNVTLVGQDTSNGGTPDAGKPLNLFVQVDPASISLESLRNMPVGTTNPVALSEVATIDEVPGAISITRINGDQAASISGQITSADTINVQSRVVSEIKKLDLPAGVEVSGGTQAQSQSDALGGLGTALLVAIALVYIVMLFWSGSLLNPFVILFSLPLAAIGAIWGLFITGKPIGITSLVGVLMLIGIVVTNAIVLLDLVEQHKARGLSTYESLVQGGRTRVRPILMTAIATIVALLPLALSVGGSDSFLTSDLAIVVMGGLFTSTFLTLLVVPVVYSLVDGARRRLMGRDVAATAPAPSQEPEVA
jgi:HAE1 family hydrophobic/amphiphilic exporter-1